MIPRRDGPSSWRTTTCGWQARRQASGIRPRWQYAGALTCALAACAAEATDRPPTDDQPPPVLSGADVVVRDPAALAGGRIGLITNHTGRTSDGRSTVDALHAHPAIDLVALFAPEHGLRGTADPGEEIESGEDVRTGLPVHSLYGETRAPTAEMLRDVDVLAFDIQDVGSRYYTYVWTMALAMQAAADHDRRFVVLDRPNPIGGALVQGNVLDPAFATFVGMYAVPMRHGMTAGELATLLNSAFSIGARLEVVQIEGWQRDAYYDETGLAWIPPSPNMPSVESATHYPGTCLFEGTNLSVGRGTPMAFQQIGAPWLDAAAVARRLEAERPAGVRIEVVTFTPDQPGDGKYGGESIAGLRYHVTERERYDPTRTAVATLAAIREIHPDSLRFLEGHFDRLAGTDRLRLGLLADESAALLTADWDEQIARFEEVRSRHLLY